MGMQGKNRLTIIFLIAFLFAFLFINSNANALCTVLTDDNTYKPGETVTVTMTCSDVVERNQDYILMWNNGTYNIENDTGTTPNVKGTPFFETLTIPVGVSWTNAFANLTGTNLEGIDYFNVTGSSANLLLINDAKFSEYALMGNLFSVDFQVTDSDGNLLDNAKCITYGTSQTEAPLQECGDQRTYHGRGVCDGVLNPDSFVEGNSYLAKIRCSCGIGDNACFDETALTVEKKSGEVTFPFIVGRWLEVNALTDKSAYTLEDEYISVCVNVTNMYDERISLNIVYSYRCGVSNEALDRIVFDTFEEPRGISANTTQNQCAALKITNAKFMQDKVNYCYASTEVLVLNKQHETKFTYAVTSPEFTITSNSTVEEGDNMVLAIFIVSIGLLFLLFMHLFRNHYGSSVVYGFISGAIFSILVMMMINGFSIIDNTFDYYLIGLFLCIALYAFVVSINLWRVGKPEMRTPFEDY